MKNRVRFLIFNFSGLQATWAACAYGATHSFPALGLIMGATYVIAHFYLSKERIRDLAIMLMIASVGIILDIALTQMHILSFPNDINNFLPIPIWLMALWFVFSLTVPYSLYWLEKNLKIAAIAGAVGGSFSYYLGYRLGALELANPLTISVGVYFISWAIFFPTALIITKQIKKNHLDIKTTT